MQEDVLDQDAFVKPWMIDLADDHYELDIGRAPRTSRLVARATR